MASSERKGLLIGAGFSRDLGMPLVTEVTDVLLGVFGKRATRLLGDALSNQEPFSKDRPINKKAIREGLDLVLDFKEKRKTNYEELLSILDSYPAKTQTDRDSFHYIFGFLYELIYAVLVAYQKHSYEILYPLHRSCFASLENFFSENETWVFSLNHDLYVECLAIDMGVPITYGDREHISFPLSNISLDDLVHFTCLQREHLNVDDGDWFRSQRGINLVRLHGGLAELQYRDDSLICNLSLAQRDSKRLLAELLRIESMGYYHNGQRIPSGRDRVVTGGDGTLDIITRAILTGGRKYTTTTNVKKGEEKLKLLDDVLRGLDELTIMGYGFGDIHVNNRLLNAMVLNPSLKLRIVDPFSAGWPDFLQQFDYGERVRGAHCTAVQWLSYAHSGNWNRERDEFLESNEPLRSKIRSKVEASIRTSPPNIFAEHRPFLRHVDCKKTG